MFGDEVGFVAGKGDNDVFVRLALKLFYPGFRFVEGGLPSSQRYIFPSVCDNQESSIGDVG